MDSHSHHLKSHTTSLDNTIQSIQVKWNYLLLSLCSLQLHSPTDEKKSKYLVNSIMNMYIVFSPYKLYTGFYVGIFRKYVSPAKPSHRVLWLFLCVAKIILWDNMEKVQCPAMMPCDATRISKLRVDPVNKFLSCKLFMMMIIIIVVNHSPFSWAWYVSNMPVD